MRYKTHEEIVNYARNKSMVIALIYSPVELYEYIVEIISKDSNNFIKKNDQIIHFKSVDEALCYINNSGAEEFFLCLDNTYDECGSIVSGQRFDYTPIHSKYRTH